VRPAGGATESCCKTKGFPNSIALETYKRGRLSRHPFLNNSSTLPSSSITTTNFYSLVTMSQVPSSSQSVDSFALQHRQLLRCFARMPQGEFPPSEDVCEWGEDFSQILVSLRFVGCTDDADSIDCSCSCPSTLATVRIPKSGVCGARRTSSSIVISTWSG
jgi:hypothetical protein